MHYFLAQQLLSSIQGRYCIAKAQLRISNTGKTNTNCLPSTKLLLLFGETRDFGLLKTKTYKSKSKQRLQINHREKTNEIREFQGC